MLTLNTLWPPRCFTTHVNWVDRPAATVIFSNGDMKPGSKPVTAINKGRHLSFLSAKE